ncbi:unnamed protein product [Rotaria socialis]|uniref:Uncharacterized protein n=1 Tax=Rotaria socialis TaxID=392032 RepID=A0A817VC76_9BILA|nr:unnamed protein product [Rotaria socialis]CAF4664902.1 unnamed protein product [Rotaria socialis]
MAQYPIPNSSGRREHEPIEFTRTFNAIQRPSVGGPQFSTFFDERIKSNKLPRPTQVTDKRINFLPPVLSLILGSNYFLTVLCIILVVPILELVIGLIFQDKCPAETNIPKYLIVTGACGIVAIALTVAIVISIKCCIKQDSIAGSCISGCVIGLIVLTILLMCVFLFAWFIAGNVWVFGAQNKIDFDNERSPNYCHSILYNFAFWIIILTYIMTVVTCCLSCCRACFGSISTLKA